MKIGILQTGHIPANLADQFEDYGGMFRQLLEGHDFDFAIYPVVDGIFPASVTDADGWLITGSKHGAYEDFPWIAQLENFIRDTYADGRPLIGICFGHQIVAQALGGKVEKFVGGWTVGHTEYDLAGEQIALNAWHQDQVTELPPEASVIGTSETCANAMLRYGDSILTLQPHPEFGAAFIRGLIDTRGEGVVPAPLLKRALNQLDAPIAQHRIANLMADFFLEGQK